MKHIKKFNSYNEDLHSTLSTLSLIGAGVAVGFFIKKLIRDLKDRKEINKYLKMTPNEKDEHIKSLKKDLSNTKFEILIKFVSQFFKNGGNVEIIDNYVWYIFKLDELIIKIHKFDKTMKWSDIRFKGILNDYFIPDSENFVEPITLLDNDIEELKKALEQDKKEMEE